MKTNYSNLETHWFKSASSKRDLVHMRLAARGVVNHWKLGKRFGFSNADIASRLP